MNAHFANGLAAIFIACGQDVAQVVNASIGWCDAELVGQDDLYVFARLPNMVVATVGGGTNLPTQSECLALIDCHGDGTAPKFAEIVAATLVAGELGIAAALANGRFIEAHRQNRDRNRRTTA
jgi:hydroxymethylglutaryl-CoA reductase (NADPH)